MNVEILLEQKICETFEKLNGLEEGSEEHSRLTNDLTALMNQYLEMKRFKEDRKHQWIKDGISAGSVIGSLGLYAVGLAATMEFERDFTHTTGPGKSLSSGIAKLLPKIHF